MFIIILISIYKNVAYLMEAYYGYNRNHFR